MRDLGTLGTGTDAQAVLINEPGQVVGWSSPLESEPVLRSRFLNHRLIHLEQREG